MTITAKIDAVTQIPEAWLTPVLPAPPSLKIEISNRCPYRCTFCALRTRESASNADLDISLFRHIASEAYAAGTREIGLFFLGESFSAPQTLVEACRIAKQQIGFPYVFLTSNGALAYPHVVRALMEAGLDSLKWSVNAADYEQFRAVMGVSVKYMDKALEHIREAWHIRERGNYSTRLYASSIAFDGEQGERMAELIETRVAPFVDEHYTLPLYGMSIRADQMEADTGYRPTHGNSGRIDPATGKPNRKPLPCWSAFREAHVRITNGGKGAAMSACCFGADARFDVGNLLEMSYMDAWNSPAMQDLRTRQIRTLTEGADALKGSPCEVCVAYG